MPGLSAHGKTLVGNFRRAFEEEYGVPVRVYHGVKFASDDSTLASIRVDGHAGGREVELHGNMKVGSAESAVLESIGIKIQIENGKGELADDEVTLGSLRGGVAARPTASAPRAADAGSAAVPAAPAAPPRSAPSGRSIRFKAKGQMHCGTFCERFLAITGLHIRTYLGYSKRPSALDQTLASARADEAPPAAAVELHGGMTVEEAERAIGEAFGFAVQLIDAAGGLLPNGAKLAAVNWNPQLPASTVTDVEVEIVDVIGEKGGRRRSSGLARASASDSRISVIMRWTAAVDLDLHAYGVMKDGSFQHVYFASKGQSGMPPFVTLDRDMGIGRAAGDNREEIGVHRLREYRAILFGTKIFNPSVGDNFARYDGKVDVGFGGETVRVPLSSSDPGTWALIAAVSTEGSEPEVINLNHIASMEPTEADVWRLVLGQEPPARSRPEAPMSGVAAMAAQVADRARATASEVTNRVNEAVRTTTSQGDGSANVGFWGFVHSMMDHRHESRQPQQAPQHDGPVAPHRAGLLLALALVGWAIPPLALVAAIMGQHDYTAMKEGRMDRAGMSMTGAAIGVGALAVVAWAVLVFSVMAMCTHERGM